MSLERLIDTREPYRHKDYSVYQEAGIFAVKYLKDHPKSVLDTRMMNLLSDLQYGAFWGPLFYLDGPANGGLDQILPSVRSINADEYQLQRQKARDWTASNFTRFELKDLMKVVIDLALHPPKIEGKPGYIRGHSILLQHMVDKPDSIFSAGVTDEGRKRLVNGAFWEELGDAYDPGALHDNLLNHFSDLDPAFASKGINIYLRNSKSSGRKHIDMRYFSTEALDKYFNFVDKLEKFGNSEDTSPVDIIPEEVIDQMLQPYILAILTPDTEDPYEFRFGEKLDLDSNQFTRPVIDIKQRITDPLILKSLGRSAPNRIAVAEDLGFKATDSQFDFAGALELLDVIGGTTGLTILDIIVKNKQKSKYELGKLTYAMSQVPVFKDLAVELSNSQPV